MRAKKIISFSLKLIEAGYIGSQALAGIVAWGSLMFSAMALYLIALYHNPSAVNGFKNIVTLIWSMLLWVSLGFFVNSVRDSLKKRGGGISGEKRDE